MLIQERVAKRFGGQVTLLSALLFCLVLLPGVSSAAMTASDCAQCHGDNVADGHHQSELFTQGLCNQCHENVTTNGDCASCHQFVPQQNAHHSTTTATSGNCAECHTSVGDLADCLDCHQGKIRTPHHDAAADPTSPIDCASCHTTMAPLAGCVGCHSGNIQTTHHDAAADPANPIDCQSCHAEITPVVNCESCHNSTDYWAGQTARDVHHATTTAAADCTTCHTDAPRPFNCHECHQGEASDRHHAMLGGTLTCANCHDDIVVDTQQLDPTRDKAYTGCQDCHAPSEANQTQHHDMAVSNPDLTCNTCHSDAGDVPGCATCHTDSDWGVDSTTGKALTAGDVHHEFIDTQGRECAECHTTMAFSNSCDACHFSGEERMREHHNPANPSIPSNLACGMCHGSGSDIPVAESCQFCHDTGFWQADGRVGNAMDQHHDVVLGSSPAVQDCVDCHATLVPQTCATCHDNDFWTATGRAGSAEAEHHDVVRLDAALSCADCHDGGLPGENNDCQACHAGEAQAFHHDTVATDGNCQECHSDLPVVESCASCHTPNDWAVDARTDHHASPTFIGGDCTQCHTGLTLGESCESCHTADQWVTDTRTDHHNAANLNGTSCNSCHESITQASGCISCHGETWTSVGPDGQLTVIDPDTGLEKPNRHHTEAGAYGFNCFSCHEYAADFSLAMPPEAKCEECHTTLLTAEPVTIPQVHHANPLYAANECGQCHGGIDGISQASLDCATCHGNQSAVVNGTPEMHHATANADQCASCHTAITPASLDCATCHAQQTARTDLSGDPAMHHATQLYVDNSCASCHQNVVALDCAGCHIDPTDTTLVPIPERHHDSEFAQNPANDCASCHTGADAAVANCELCHVGGDQPAVSDRHHVTTSYTPDNCASCHEGIDGVTGDALDCATCHAGTALTGDPAMHHKTQDGAPNYAVDNCATCHNVMDFEQLMAAGECVSCHTGGNTEIMSLRHHSTDPALTDDCASCHTVEQAELDCATCHANQSPKDGKAAMHHATAAATASDANCIDCHASVDVTNVTCETCHASQPVFNGGLAMHHGTAAFGAGECMTCHTGADSALIDCAWCHVDNTNPDQIATRHHTGEFASAPTTDCVDCHSAVNTAELDCELCHAQQPADLTGTPAMHHNLTIAGTTGPCVTCHTGATVAENDCSACHLTPEKPPIAEVHHATPTADTGLCSACHEGTEATAIICADCHGDDSNHHIQPAYAGGVCNSCHTDITLNGANCESCHTGGGQTIPDTHHAAPLTEVGGDCSVCHEAVSSPDVCSNCHASSPHHTTMASQYGVCENCHSWPADKDENPQQASCRQCHGEYQHGKNSAAPIHDYRICFDCHNPDVFHAKPAQGVGLTNPAPGKGTFNLFNSTIGGKDRSNYTDRYGDQERWENLDRDVYRSPAISYTLVQISEGGNTYQVPAFDNIPTPDIGGGTDPGPGPGETGLESCTSCHSDYSSLVACDNMTWRDHETLNRVDLATYQLAESTYLGSYCPDLPPPSSGDGDVDPNGTYVEAEAYNHFGNNFSERSDSSASGGTYLLAETNSTRSTSGTATGYQLNFTETGTYYIWFLGNSNGSSGDNSLWYGVNGNKTGNANFSTSSGYRWTRDNYNDGPEPTRISISSPGTHTINIWARENGLRFDGFYLTKSSSASPSTGGSSDDGSSDDGSSAGENLAEGKSARASDDEGSSYSASRAVDGSTSTRWYVRSSRDEWLRVDLGQRYNVSRVVIKWHSEYAREYDVEVSTDGYRWTKVHDESSGDGGTETITFSSREARYVLIDCKQERDNGYSIYELEVYE